MEHLVRSHLEAGNWLKAQQAIECYLDSLRTPSPEQLAEAAYWRCQANDFLGASRLYQQACDQVPEHPTYHYNLATTLRVIGDITGADAALCRHIDKSPEDAEAHWLKVQLGRQGADKTQIVQLTRLTQAPLPPKQRVHAWYALGKWYEDNQFDDASFNAYQSGASLRRRYLKYSVANDQAIMQAIGSHFSSTWLDNTTTTRQGEQNIFIVGMPRSGTTLVDNLLGAHQGVAMGGELNTFATSMMAEVATRGKSMAVQQAIAEAVQCDYNAIGRSYLNGIRDYVQGSRFVTDKLPLNFLYLGLIHKALPDAKIIHVQRHPMDVVWSIFKHLFTHAYPFSYDLDEIADYYIAYRGLMTHWQNLFSNLSSNPMLTVSYEALVENPAAQMQRITRFCGIDYDAVCFDFYRRPTTVTTGSAAQVREPINTRSIGQWKRFSAQLAKVQEKLQKAQLL